MPGVKGRCGGKREGAGRKPEIGGANPRTAWRPSPEVREWLDLWDDTPYASLSYLLERAMKFWPDGPHRAGATQKRRKAKLLRESV
jgi:hypothetical protein